MNKELIEGLKDHYTVREVEGVHHLRCRYCPFTAEIPKGLQMPMFAKTLLQHPFTHTKPQRDRINQATTITRKTAAPKAKRRRTRKA